MTDGRTERQPATDLDVPRWVALGAIAAVCVMILVIIIYGAWHGPGH